MGKFAKYIYIDDCEFTNWGGRAVYGLGSPTGTSQYIYVRRNYFHTPFEGDTKYPIYFGGATYEYQYVYVDGNVIRGPDLAWDSTDPDKNNATADQIALQGCAYFQITNNWSFFGGELGILVAQGSRHGLIANNFVIESDTNGIRVGSDAGAQTTDVSVVDNYVLNAGMDRDNFHADTSACGLYFGNSDDCMFTGNYIVDTLNVTKYGVRIDDSTSISRGSNRIIDVDIADYYEDGTNSFNEMDVFARKIVSPVGVPTLTIASGEITVTGSYHDLLNEGGAGTDDLDTINGGTDGMVLDRDWETRPFR